MRKQLCRQRTVRGRGDGPGHQAGPRGHRLDAGSAPATWSITTPAGCSAGAAGQGDNRGLSFDPELLYIGAMFHDLGLNEEFRRQRPRGFEVDSADEARRFLHGHGVPEDSIRRVWTAIAPAHHARHPGVHGTRGRPGHRRGRVRRARHRLPRHQRRRPGRDHRAAPAAGFKRQILQAFTDGMAPRPETTFGTSTPDVLERLRPRLQARQLRGRHPELDWPE